MNKFVVQHLSGDYFGDKIMTPLAGCAEQYTEKQAQALYGHRRDCRILPYQVVDRAPNLPSIDGYDGRPVADVVRLGECETSFAF